MGGLLPQGLRVSELRLLPGEGGAEEAWQARRKGELPSLLPPSPCLQASQGPLPEKETICLALSEDRVSIRSLGSKARLRVNPCRLQVSRRDWQSAGLAQR